MALGGGKDGHDHRPGLGTRAVHEFLVVVINTETLGPDSLALHLSSTGPRNHVTLTSYVTM